jgi:hypothetical protein
MDLKEILQAVDTVLVIDWPDKVVPELLTLSGLHVIVRRSPDLRTIPSMN